MVEFRTILITLMTIIIVGLVILLFYEFAYGGDGTLYKSSRVVPYKTSVRLIDALHRGKDYMKIDSALPLSNNEDDGIEFSYAASISVDDYDWEAGSDYPIIFVKGSSDLSRQSPSVTMRKGSNSIIVAQDTYDSEKPGIVIVRNLPAGKIISLAICVKQTSMDVYVNGTLYSHLTLAALPMQNTGSVLVADNGGWLGSIGNFAYYNYALSYNEIQTLANKKPERSSEDIPPYGPYFSPSWWVGGN